MADEAEYEIGTILGAGDRTSGVFVVVAWRPTGRRRWRHYNLAGQLVVDFLQAVNDATAHAAEREKGGRPAPSPRATIFPTA